MKSAFRSAWDWAISVSGQSPQQVVFITMRKPSFRRKPYRIRLTDGGMCSTWMRCHKDRFRLKERPSMTIRGLTVGATLRASFKLYESGCVWVEVLTLVKTADGSKRTWERIPVNADAIEQSKRA